VVAGAQQSGGERRPRQERSVESVSKEHCFRECLDGQLMKAEDDGGTSGSKPSLRGRQGFLDGNGFAVHQGQRLERPAREEPLAAGGAGAFGAGHGGSAHAQPDVIAKTAAAGADGVRVLELGVRGRGHAR
jgi:hypothetical protein